MWLPSRSAAAGQRGTALLLAAVALVVVVSGLLALGAAASAVAGGARADATADLVALAGAGGSPGSAALVAHANGAALQTLRRVGEATVVVIHRDGHEAVAAAAPASGSPGPDVREHP